MFSLPNGFKKAFKFTVYNCRRFLGEKKKIEAQEKGESVKLIVTVTGIIFNFYGSFI